MGANNADFLGITTHVIPDGDATRVEAHHNGQQVGAFTWNTNHDSRWAGKIADVTVLPEYRRKGIATKMYQHAISHSEATGAPYPEHGSLSEDGEAWANKVGGPHWEDPRQSGWDME